MTITKKDMLTEQEILSRNIIKDVVGTLDDGDDHSYSGYYLDTNGTRLYSLKRVEFAEQLISNSINGEYFHKEADFLNKQLTPYTKSIFTFDYRIILKNIDSDLYWKIRKSRLSHPHLGRIPQSYEEEREYILRGLIKIVQYADPSCSISSKDDLFNYLDKLSKDAIANLGRPWPKVILRKAYLRKNISKSFGIPTVMKTINILSLIHTGKLPFDLIIKNNLDIPHFLSASPVIRVDYKINIMQH